MHMTPSQIRQFTEVFGQAVATENLTIVNVRRAADNSPVTILGTMAFRRTPAGTEAMLVPLAELLGPGSSVLYHAPNSLDNPEVDDEPPVLADLPAGINLDLIRTRGE